MENALVCGYKISWVLNGHWKLELHCIYLPQTLLAWNWSHPDKNQSLSCAKPEIVFSILVFGVLCTGRALRQYRSKELRQFTI